MARIRVSLRQHIKDRPLKVRQRSTCSARTSSGSPRCVFPQRCSSPTLQDPRANIESPTGSTELRGVARFFIRCQPGIHFGHWCQCSRLRRLVTRQAMRPCSLFSLLAMTWLMANYSVRRENPANNVPTLASLPWLHVVLLQLALLLIPF